MTTIAAENLYEGREQTLAKHIILKGYLQALAFKILQSPHEVLTYVDGYSGPWRTQTESFSDTSFMIAINVLKDAQDSILKATGKRKTVRCLLIEKDAAAHRKLSSAVSVHNDPGNKFFIETVHGEFEEATDRIVKCVGNSFALVFIDPTGWTGYAYDRIKSVLQHRQGEVLINFMYDHANRFAMS
jgi:three-Cys-motif partner protein